MFFQRYLKQILGLVMYSFVEKFERYLLIKNGLHQEDNRQKIMKTPTV
jgi:hypothetical protein